MHIMCLCSRKVMERWKCHFSIGLGFLAIFLSSCHAEGEELLFIFWKYGYLRLCMRVSTADWANLPSRCSLKSVQHYCSYSSYVFLGFICLFFWYPSCPTPLTPPYPDSELLLQFQGQILLRVPTGWKRVCILPWRGEKTKQQEWKFQK